MLRIGKTYVVRTDGISRLCADLTIDDRRTTLWFGVDSAYEEWLALGRADAFVMALLPCAMRDGHEIVCENPMSERLHHQLVTGLIPALSSALEPYHSVKIYAPLTTEEYPNSGAVGTGFSGGIDSLYTVMRHRKDSEFPLTHIAVFNLGSPWRSRETLLKIFRRAEIFGAEQGLQAFFVDTNYRDVLPERLGTVYTFRNLSCILALQGLFKTYMVSSGPEAAKFKLDLIVFCYDLLLANCSATESLSIYLSGVEITRSLKLAALTEWEPSRRWLNACTVMEGESRNCGHCKKCIRDMTVLYAMGQLEQYQAIFDVSDYLKHIPERIGYVLASSNGHNTGFQVIQFLKERNVPIPKAAYTYEKMFRLVKQKNAENNREEENWT